MSACQSVPIDEAFWLLCGLGRDAVAVVGGGAAPEQRGPGSGPAKPACPAIEWGGCAFVGVCGREAPWWTQVEFARLSVLGDSCHSLSNSG